MPSQPSAVWKGLEGECAADVSAQGIDPCPEGIVVQGAHDHAGIADLFPGVKRCQGHTATTADRDALVASGDTCVLVELDAAHGENAVDACEGRVDLTGNPVHLPQ